MVNTRSDYNISDTIAIKSINTKVSSEYMNATYQHGDSNVDLTEIPNDIMIIKSAIFY